MRAEWVATALELAGRPADFYSGCRKILTGVMVELPVDDDLTIEDSGFTRNKLSMLRRLYWSDEHAERVAELWRGRVERGKYGSISVSTYHHITKSDPAKRSKRASVMGPCLLGVSFTLLDKRTIALDAFYRTTEFLKKFPADLIFIRDTVMPALGVERVSRLRCHFANVTLHPMYVSTIIPHLKRPIDAFEVWRESDPRFWQWAVKWTARYVCDEYAHGILKFAQALRVMKDARERIEPKQLAALQKYFRDNHPGYTHTRFKHEEESGDE